MRIKALRIRSYKSFKVVEAVAESAVEHHRILQIYDQLWIAGCSKAGALTQPVPLEVRCEDAHPGRTGAGRSHVGLAQRWHAERIQGRLSRRETAGGTGLFPGHDLQH